MAVINHPAPNPDHQHTDNCGKIVDVGAAVAGAGGVVFVAGFIPDGTIVGLPAVSYAPKLQVES